MAKPTTHGWLACTPARCTQCIQHSPAKSRTLHGVLSVVQHGSSGAHLAPEE